MPSDSGFDTAAPQQTRSVRVLLDLFFGFLVWAIHFLIVYCANALACARGIGAASPAIQGAFKSLLLIVTVAAIAVVLTHAWRTWCTRQHDRIFLTRLTIGNDAVAAAGIAMQFFPLLMLHLCR